MSALATLRTRAASLASKAAAAADPAVKAAAAEYDKLIAANAAYVVKDPAAADRLFKQLVFTKLARIPQGAAECRTEWAAVRRTWAGRRDLPLSEAGMYALFAGEVFAWFCVGEIVGRGFTFGGYAV